ncbi:hypothetical protein DFH07DRAFT_724250, partial [Mycena maculata]
LIGHLWGGTEGRRNDNHLLAVSEILDLCRMHATRPGTNANTPAHERYFQLFGDPAYGLKRTEEEAEWNAAMAAVRIEVEHGFGGILALWPFANAWWKHKVWSSPVSRYYRVAVLLTNAHNCIRPNQTAQYFECEPPTLEEYFHD